MSDAERTDDFPLPEHQSIQEPPIEGAVESRSVRRPLSNIPPITTAIGVICVLMAVVVRLQPQVTVELMFYPPISEAQPYRYLTSAFIHSGFWHLVLNMYALWLLGRVIEPVLGKIHFLALYLVSIFGGNVAVYLLAGLTGAWNIGAVGASGAIFGLFGALVVLSKRVEANMSGILTLLAINLAFGLLVPGISWESHVGGLLVGMLLTWMWTLIFDSYRGQGVLQGKALFRTLADAATTLIVVSALALVIVL